MEVVGERMNIAEVTQMAKIGGAVEKGRNKQKTLKGGKIKWGTIEWRNEQTENNRREKGINRDQLKEERGQIENNLKIEIEKKKTIKERT